MTMFVGDHLARAVHQRQGGREVDDDLIGLPEGQAQKTVIAQIADAVFGDFRPGALFVSIVTALILVLAANTAFNGFPVLGSILARDGYLPRQLHTRGDRLAFSNGILVLSGDGDRADRHLPGRRLEADPALHRGCVHLVHAEPARA